MFEVASGEVYVSTSQSARNMAYQGFMKKEGQVEVLMEVTGQVRKFHVDLF